MKKFLAALLAASLVACSGGGGSKSSTCTTDCPVTAANLIVSLSKQELLDVSNDSVAVTVTAVDASNNAVAGAVVQVVPQGALYSATSNTTDSSGKVTGTITISDDKTDHDVIVTVTSGSISKQVPLLVKGSRLSATVKDVVLSPGATTTVTYKLIDANSVPIANASIAVSQSSGTVGQTGDTVTDSNGNYVYTFNAPSSTGEVVVTGSAGKVSVISSIKVNSGSLPPVTTDVATASMALSPSTIGTNTVNSTLNQVAINATFLDVTGAPIPNIRVRFDLPGDGATVVGGTITSDGVIVTTDENGVAQTQYIPGTRASGAGGLTIRACWDYDDFDAVGATGTCPSGHTLTQTLTISNLPLSIFATSSFKLTPDDNTSVYTMPVVVQVTDSAGHPKSGVTLDSKITSKYYYKGTLIDNGAGAYAINQVATCSSEDVRGNGSLASWEDANGSGRLEPAAAAVTLYPLNRDENNRITDAAGLAYFTLQWAQTAALWQDAVMTFNTTVAGTEGNVVFRIPNLPAPADLFTDSSILVPFQTSPYGVTKEQAPNGTLPGVTKQVYLTDPATNLVVMDWLFPTKQAAFCTTN